MSSSTQANSFDPNTTSFSWSLGDQINRVLPCQWLGYFEKSLLTLKETIAKTQTTTTTSNTQMWTATPNYSCRSIAKRSKVLEVNCPFLSPSTQVSAAQKTPCQNKSRPHPPPCPPKSRMGKWRVFTLHGASSLIWGDGGFLFHFILYDVPRKV